MIENNVINVNILSGQCSQPSILISQCSSDLESDQVLSSGPPGLDLRKPCNKL